MNDERMEGFFDLDNPNPDGTYNLAPGLLELLASKGFTVVKSGNESGAGVKAENEINS